MNNDLLTLARQLAAVPGFRAPWWIAADLVPRDNPYPDGGIQWRQDPDNFRAWIPDLSDPSGATGGVLLQMVGPCNVSRMTSGEWVILGPGMIGEEGATLAEACARVIVALGRVGDV